VTQIHISIDHVLDSRRRGISETPHVLSAQGRVWLSPPPLPRPVFSIPVKSPAYKCKPSSKYATDEDTDEDHEKTTEDRNFFEESDLVGSETEDDDDDNMEDIDLELDVDYWNGASDSFAKFLARYMGSPLPVSSPSSPRDPSAFEYVSQRNTLLFPSTPDLTHSSSIYSSPGPTLATSSPPRPSSCVPVLIVSPSRLEDKKGYVILSLPALTPSPVKARPIRKRMKKIEERMGKIKKGEWACRYDEVENDELAQDGEKGKIPGMGVETKEPPDWDPFGDEEEL